MCKKCGVSLRIQSECGKMRTQWTACFYLILSIFIKQKQVWNQPPCLIFCITFEGKFFTCYSPLIDQVSWSSCFYFLRYWAICVLQLFVNQVVTSKTFETNLIFLIKRKSKDKNLNVLRRKELLS